MKRIHQHLTTGLFAAAFAMGALLVAAGSATANIVETFDADQLGTTFASDFVANTTADGGTGWAGPWTTDSDSDTFRFKGDDGGLDVDVDGYAVEPNAGFLQTDGGNNRIVREFAAPFGSGSTAWGSVLITSPLTGSEFAGFDRLFLELNDKDSQKVKLGFQGRPIQLPDDSFVGNTEPALLQVDYGNQQAQVLAPDEADAVNLFVFNVQIDENGVNDRLRVWINPDGPLSDEASLGTPDADFSDADLLGSQFDSIALEGRWASAQSSVDQIRIGSALTDAGIIPEPGSVTIGLVGLAILATRRRNRA